MITKVKVENFRCFEQFTMTGIKPITFIGGRNNSGKSAFLEAVILAKGFRSMRLIGALQNIRENRPGMKFSMNTLWEPFFFDFSKTDKFRIKLLNDESLEVDLTVGKIFDDGELFANNQGIFDSRMPLYNNMKRIKHIIAECKGADEYKCTVDLVNDVFQMNVEPRIEEAKTNEVAIYYSSTQKNNSTGVAEWISKMIFADNKSLLVELLQIFEKDIADIITVTDNKEPYAYVVMKDKRKISLNYMGDGINKALDLLMNILDAPHGVVLVDEIENGLHYSVYEKVLSLYFEAAAKVGCQLFLTTHSVNILKAAVQIMKDAGRLNEVGYQRMDFSRSVRKAFCFSGEELDHALNHNGMEIR